MTAQAEDTTEVQTSTPVHVPAEAEKSTHEELYPWRMTIHVPGAAFTCAHANDGKCEDEDHFHALIRLPNPYQHNDIVEKCQAARARRLRMYRDVESDASVILEDELEGLKSLDPAVIADELVDRDFAEHYTAAVREVEQRLDPDYVVEDDEEIPKLYGTIDQDREEYLRQQELPEEQRSDDFAELEKTYTQYSLDVREELEKVQAPRREHLLSLGMDELISMVRRSRIEQAATNAYLETYAMWQMYVGTYKLKSKGTPVDRYWPNINHMRYIERSQVIQAVREGYELLEQQLQRTRTGKDF